MRDEGRLMSGRQLRPPPGWLIGAVDNPSADVGAGAARLGQKVEAGAQFVQTQFVFDTAAFAAWMSRVRDLGLHEQCHVLAGVGPVRSLRALAHLRSVPGVHIPDAVADRLGAAGPDQVAQEGLRLCTETIGALRQIPGVAGIHVMAVGNEGSIPEILRRAGIGARQQVSGAAQA
jgi:methylenetetrahydrofolate reductase (NADPH)